MKFEIIDIVTKGDIIELFNGESYSNTCDGFMTRASVYYRGYSSIDSKIESRCIRDAYSEIKRVYNKKRRVIAKRKNPTSTLVDVTYQHYLRRKQKC